MKRGIFDIILFLSLFILPWWVGAILAMVGIFVFKKYYEFIISGMIIYSIFTIPGSGLLTSSISFFALLIILYQGIQILRRRIILYDSSF